MQLRPPSSPRRRSDAPKALDNVKAVVLYHATDAAGVEGIPESGFAHSSLSDSPNANWLSSSREEAETIAACTGWLVIVEIPSEFAEQHRYRFSDGTPYLDNYRVPWAVLNEYRPFRFARADAAAT
jgi:hypothetical protein